MISCVIRTVARWHEDTTIDGQSWTVISSIPTNKTRKITRSDLSAGLHVSQKKGSTKNPPTPRCHRNLHRYIEENLLSLNLLVSEMFPVSAVCLNGCEHDYKPVIPTFGNLVLTENTEEIFRTRCLTPIRQENVDSFGLFF